MRALFTVHAGEFLVGEFIERKFRRANVWVPTKDSGIDLLVTDSKNKKSVSLQVKFSRDFLPTHMPTLFQKPLRACGWWTINRNKLVSSVADYWILALFGFEHRSTDFVIIPPRVLRQRLETIHGKQKTFQSYLWVTENNNCWETRGLKRQEQVLISQGQFVDLRRNLTPYLNNWESIKKLDR